MTGFFMSFKRSENTMTAGEPTQLYNSRRKIASSKYTHFQELKSVIPSDYHSFYDALPHDWKSTVTRRMHEEQLIQKELFCSYVNAHSFLFFNYVFVNKIQILKKTAEDLSINIFLSYSLLVFACHCVKIFDPVLLPLPHTHKCIHFFMQCDEVDINISQLNRFLLTKLSY